MSCPSKLGIFLRAESIGASSRVPELLHLSAIYPSAGMAWMAGLRSKFKKKIKYKKSYGIGGVSDAAADP